MDDFEARKLDRSSFVPLYYQLTEILKEQIESGIWQPGDVLPSEPKLAETFGVSRVVVRQALSILEADHQIVRAPGKGTFVAEPKLDYRAGGLIRLLDSKQIASVEVHVIDKRPVRPERNIRELLGAVDGEIVRVNTLLVLRGMLLAVGYSFFRQPNVEWLLDAAIPGRTLGGDLSLAPHGIELTHSEIGIEASQCQPFEAEMLGVETGDPTFLILSTEYGSVEGTEAAPVEVARFSYRSDVLQFQLQVSGDSTGTLAANWMLNDGAEADLETSR